MPKPAVPDWLLKANPALWDRGTFAAPSVNRPRPVDTIAPPAAPVPAPSEPPPGARYLNHRMVKVVLRECGGYDQFLCDTGGTFPIANEVVWICEEELKYLRAFREIRPDQLARADIAVMNSACAEGLPGSEGQPHVDEMCRQLDAWAACIRRETEQRYGQFLSYPEEYDHSEPYCRMLVLCDVLKRVYGVRYNPDQIANYTWDDSRNEFIHGILGPSRAGTCVTLPVLLIALGRRLGYPLKLVLTNGHMFGRWDDPSTGVWLNLEYHGHGLVVYPDEHYRHSPVAWTPEFRAREERMGPDRMYLRSLTPKEELAAFVCQRGHVWEAIGRWGEANKAYNLAADLSPHHLGYEIRANETWRKMVNPGYEMDERWTWKGVTVNRPDPATYEEESDVRANALPHSRFQ